MLRFAGSFASIAAAITVLAAGPALAADGHQARGTLYAGAPDNMPAPTEGEGTPVENGMPDDGATPDNTAPSDNTMPGDGEPGSIGGAKTASAVQDTDVYHHNDGKSRKFCTMYVGDKGVFLEAKADQPDWVFVTGISGDCQGKDGWVWNGGSLKIE